MDDEYILDTPVVRDFIAGARAAIAEARSPQAACDAIRPASPSCSPTRTGCPSATRRATRSSGMGGGIGQWLLFRAGDRSLTLFALVVPSGSETPVHDHLAWGLVGLYRGTQDEDIFAGDADRARARAASWRPATSTRCSRPPATSTASAPPRAETSVSIHLLTNDTGCVWRHAYDAETGAVDAVPLRLRERALRGRGLTQPQ